MEAKRYFHENCALVCEFCPKGRTHHCRKCHMNQEYCENGVFRIHRSSQCNGSGPECTVCGAKGTHDERNCPNREHFVLRQIDYLNVLRQIDCLNVLSQIDHLNVQKHPDFCSWRCSWKRKAKKVWIYHVFWWWNQKKCIGISRGRRS